METISFHSASHNGVDLNETSILKRTISFVNKILENISLTIDSIDTNYNYNMSCIYFEIEIIE